MSLERGIIIDKYGGEALSTPEAFMRSAEVLQSHIGESNRVVVVVSAMAKVTDKLHKAFQAAIEKKPDTVDTVLNEIRQQHTDAIKKLGGSSEDERRIIDVLREVRFSLRNVTPSSLIKRYRDEIVSAGERMSPFILQLALQNLGIPSVVLDARNIVLTDKRYGNARPKIRDTAKQVRHDLLPKLERNRVVVVGGYMGRDADGYTTTLGRGGSDYTATILARTLHELGFNDERIQVFLNKADSKIKGIMSGDPNYVRGAKEIPHLTRKMARLMSRMGAKVLHERAVEPLEGTDIALYCKNVLYPADPGTLIDGAPDSSGIKAVTALYPLKGIQINFSPDDRNTLALAIYEVVKMGDIPLRASFQEIGDDSMNFIFEDEEDLDSIRETISSLVDCRFDLKAFDDRSVVGTVGTEGSEADVMREIMGGTLHSDGEVRRGGKILKVSSTPGLSTIIFEHDLGGETVKETVQSLHNKFFSN